jgi:hypothetical protein
MSCILVNPHEAHLLLGHTDLKSVLSEKQLECYPSITPFALIVPFSVPPPLSSRKLLRLQDRYIHMHGVVLFGGSTNHHHVSDFFSVEEPNRSVNPDGADAHGPGGSVSWYTDDGSLRL